MASLDHPLGAFKPRPGNVRLQTADEPPDQQPPGFRPFAKLYLDLAGEVSGAGINQYVRYKNLTRGRGVIHATDEAIAERMGLSPGHVRRLNKELVRAGLIQRRYRRILILDELGQGGMGNPGDCEDPRANRAQTARDPRADLTTNPRAKRADLGEDPRAKRADPPPPNVEERSFRKDGEISTFNVGGPPDPDRIKRAERLIGSIRGRGWAFDRGRVDGKVGFRPLCQVPGEPPTAEELMKLAELRAEVLAVLDGCGGAKRSLTAGDESGATMAPPVKTEDRARAHKLIGRLEGAGYGPDCDELARALAGLFRDADQEGSQQTYRGLARDAACGVWPLSPGLLSDAFDEACRPGVRNRGACFVRAVKRLKSVAFRRRRSEDVTPSPA